MRWTGNSARIATTIWALMLAGCTNQGQLSAKSTLASNPHQQLAEMERRIFVLVERDRLKTNPAARPLALDPELTAVARTHSEDMAREHFLGHRAPNGETTARLIMARDKSFQGLLGENIAAQYYTKAAGININTYARRFVKTWMQSKSHRDNLAFSDYTQTGVGVAINGHEVFVTQLFADAMPPHPDASKSVHARVAKWYTNPTVAMRAKPSVRAKKSVTGTGAPQNSTP